LRRESFACRRNRCLIELLRRITRLQSTITLAPDTLGSWRYSKEFLLIKRAQGPVIASILAGFAVMPSANLGGRNIDSHRMGQLGGIISAAATFGICRMR
jgi:hypothetical protein